MNPLHARIRSELNRPSFSAPDENLSYVDRQNLNEDNYAPLVRDRLPRVNRQLKWTKVNAGTAGLLLLMSTVLSGVMVFDESLLSTNPSDLAFLFFMASTLGISALGGLWKARTLERRKLLFELVIERDASSESPSAHADAPSSMTES